MEEIDDGEDAMDLPAEAWRFRWPDPVAIQVAHNRILDGLDPDAPELNPRVSVMVHMEPPSDDEDLARAILVTPWGVERIYWGEEGQAPPIHTAYPLEVDRETGLVVAGQGLLLKTDGRRVPVTVGLEPETGHYFSQRLLHSVAGMTSAHDALQAAMGRSSTSERADERRSVSGHLERPVSRRGLLGLFR